MRRRTFIEWISGLLAGAIGSRPSLASNAGQPNYPPPMPPERREEWDRMRAKMLSALPYQRIEVPGERALIEWERIRAEGKGWPVIVGDDEQLDAIAEQFSIDDQVVFPMPPSSAQQTPPPQTPAAILAEAAKLSFPQCLKQWSGYDPDLPEPPLGEWPVGSTVENVQLTVASDILTGKPFARAHILVIPTTNSWEVPAYLRWGNWNACPPPSHHVAALRSWHERFGVELVGINRDTLNLRASRRPLDRKPALDLAYEQYVYCPDVIDQGVGSQSALAALLMANDWWFFWWDLALRMFAVSACPNHPFRLSKIRLPDGSEWTVANGRALGFARWDKLWAKPCHPPKFIFKIMFLHAFFGYLPLRHQPLF